jgi:hypothetical protein
MFLRCYSSPSELSIRRQSAQHRVIAAQVETARRGFSRDFLGTAQEGKNEGLKPLLLLSFASTNTSSSASLIV